MMRGALDALENLLAKSWFGALCVICILWDLGAPKDVGLLAILAYYSLAMQIDRLATGDTNVR